jgi:hypothetical protein
LGLSLPAFHDSGCSLLLESNASGAPESGLWTALVGYGAWEIVRGGGGGGEGGGRLPVSEGEAVPAFPRLGVGGTGGGGGVFELELDIIRGG